MANSGYGKDSSKEVLQSGIRRYYRLVLHEVAGIRALYRLPEEMAPTRILKDMKSKARFKPSRGGKKVSLAKDYPVKTNKQYLSTGTHTNGWKVKGPGQQTQGGVAGQKEK